MTWSFTRGLTVVFGRRSSDCHHEELTPIDCYAWFPGLDGYPGDVFSWRARRSGKWSESIELYLTDRAAGTDGEDSPGFV